MTTFKPDCAVAERMPDGALPSLPLVGRLRLNLSALGITLDAPDLGERLCRLSRDNEPYGFEISAKGELIVAPLSGWDTGANEQEVNTGVGVWRRENGGATFPPTVMFQLPSGARYMPDASWITQERYDTLLSQLVSDEYRSVIEGAPDFVVEVRSRTDDVQDGLAKMREWMDGGAKLGWCIDPYRRRAYIYRAGPDDIEILDDPETLSGEDVLPGFVFEVHRLIFARYGNLPDSGKEA